LILARNQAEERIKVRNGSGMKLEIAI